MSRSCRAERCQRGGSSGLFVIFVFRMCAELAHEFNQNYVAACLSCIARARHIDREIECENKLNINMVGERHFCRKKAKRV